MWRRLAGRRTAMIRSRGAVEAVRVAVDTGACVGQDKAGETFVSRHFRMDPSAVQSFLERHKATYKETDGKAILKYCPFCHPTRDKPDNLWKMCVYLNSGRCACVRCGTKASFFDLKQRMSGKGAPRAGPHTPEPAPALPDQHMLERYTSNLASMTEVSTYLSSTRGLHDDTVAKYRVGATLESFLDTETRQREDHPCVVFPWIAFDESTSSGRVVQRYKLRSLRDKRRMRLEPKGGAWGLFGWHTVPTTATQLVLTEGEYDAMAVYQATGLPAVSLPNGANNLPVSLLPSLERFKRIVLWMDDDQAGQQGAEKIAKKLGIGRCVLVHSRQGDPEGPKDANDALRQGVDLNRLLQTAQPLPHKEIAGFEDIKQDLFRELTQGAVMNGTPLLTLPGLTNVLKGHRLGELSIVTGPTGVGKTTVMSQISVDLCAQGVRTLWGSFEIRNHRLLRTMMSQHCGRAIDADSFEEASEAFSKLDMYFLKFFGSSNVNAVLDAMEHAVYVYDVEHILLDNLQFMIGHAEQSSGRFDRYEVQDRAISLFRSFATKHNVHITLAVHPRKENDGALLGLSSVFGSAKVTQEADNVMLVQNADRTQQLRTLNVQKNRFDGTTGHIPFRFDKESRRIVEMNRQEFAQVKSAVDGQAPRNSFAPPSNLTSMNIILD